VDVILISVEGPFINWGICSICSRTNAKPFKATSQSYRNGPVTHF